MIDSLNELVAPMVGVLSISVPAVSTYFYKIAEKRDRENKERDNRHTALDKEFRNFLAELPLIYATKDDFNRGIDDVKDAIWDLRKDLRK